MDPGRWSQIQALFHDALARPDAERVAFIRHACGADGELLAEVQSLLDADSGEASLLDRNLGEVADDLLESAETAPKPPAGRFGPYRLIRLLGEGGMGVVYLAEREDLHSQAAIKILRDAWLSPARRERFTAEQRTLAQLTHPYIARLYDADSLPDGTPWFVMEYVEGQSLTEYCRNQASSLSQRLRLFREVCEAVAYAHSQAVIHRDLKPSNIMVKSDGSIRLLDFGIAKPLDALDLSIGAESGAAGDLRSADSTRTLLRLMTPAYAAPEQIRGERAGVPSDIYALGVILYELIARQQPNRPGAASPDRAMEALAGRDPAKPSLSHTALPASRAEWADLDVLCLTAMHAEPSRRYRSVEAMIRDLDHFQHREPLEARPDSWPYRAAKFIRRNRAAVAVSGVAAAALMALAVFFTVDLARARNAAVAEAARTQRIQQFTTNLFQGGDAEAGPSDDLKVVTLVDRGVAEAQSMQGDPAMQADLYMTLGGISQKLDRLDQADTLLNTALTRRKATYGAGSAEAGEAMSALALLRIDQSKLDDAEALARQGLQLAMRQLRPGDGKIATATHDLGEVLEARGKYDEATQALNTAVRLRSATGIPAADLAESVYELANTRFYAGDYAQAEALTQRALLMHQHLFGQNHPLVAGDLTNLGAIQFNLGHYPEAERFDREALTMTSAFYGEDRAETAAAMTMLGRTLVRENRFDDAEGMLQKALAIRQRVYGPVSPNVASTLNELGSAAMQTAHYPQAEANFSRMIDIYKQVYHGRHFLIGIAVSNLASTYVKENEFARAEPLCREAVQRFTDTVGAGDLNTGIVRIKLGRVLLLERQFAEAARESRAGYDVLVAKKTAPDFGFLQNARMDLAREYSALKQPKDAAAFQSEYDSYAAKKG